jgi:hypothetical protein
MTVLAASLLIVVKSKPSSESFTLPPFASNVISPSISKEKSPASAIDEPSMVISSTINWLVFNTVDTATLVKVALSPILMLSMLSVPTARVVIVALSNTAESP